MGSALGPWGMALGAALGGIVGFLTNSANAAAIQFESTNERLERLNK